MEFGTTFVTWAIEKIASFRANKQTASHAYVVEYVIIPPNRHKRSTVTSAGFPLPYRCLRPKQDAIQFETD